MAEYFATREGMIEVIYQHLLFGNHKDAEIILDAINDYKAQFVYKCKYSWCPLRKKNTIASHSYPGFKSVEDLETHRLSHPHHELYQVRYSVIGTPWYECQCQHSDKLNDEELELYFEGKFFDKIPQSRLQHLERVSNDRVSYSTQV